MFLRLCFRGVFTTQFDLILRKMRIYLLIFTVLSLVSSQKVILISLPFDANIMSKTL